MSKRKAKAAPEQPAFLREVEAGVGHSPLGASSAHRWVACPGSVALAHGQPNDSSREAKEGTAAHELAARCLNLGQEAWEYAGEKITVEGKDFEVDADMVEAVAVLLDFVRDRAVEPDVLQVVDYKHGVGIGVEVEENPQLMYYAAGALHYVDELREAGLVDGGIKVEHNFNLDDLHPGLWGTADVVRVPAGPPETVEIVVVQPRHEHPDGPVRVWRTSVDALGEWVESTLLPAARATLDPEAPLKTGEHCRFCPARLVCPALAEDFKELTDVAQDTKDGGGAEAVKTLETDELADMLARVGPLRFLVKALEDEAFRRLMQGDEVPGHKLVHKKAARVWREGAEEEVAGKLGDAAYERSLVSPAKAEKLRGGKELTKRLAFKPETGVTLAPEGDRRSAVPARTAKELFDGV